jgi:hypothetical protein
MSGQIDRVSLLPRMWLRGILRSLEADPEGRRRIAVNLRLTELEAVANLPINRFEGLESFEDLSRDGRCVRDYWF